MDTRSLCLSLGFLAVLGCEPREAVPATQGANVPGARPTAMTTTKASGEAAVSPPSTSPQPVEAPARSLLAPPASNVSDTATNASAGFRLVLAEPNISRGATQASFEITNLGTARLRIPIYDGRNVHNQLERLTDRGWRPAGELGYCGVGGRSPIVVDPGETERFVGFVRGRAGTLRLRVELFREETTARGRKRWRRHTAYSEPFERI